MHRDRTGRRIALAALAAALLAPTGTVGAPAAAATRAAPTCRPASAPSVVGVDGSTATTTVPRCASATGVSGYRIQAMDRAGTTAVRSADVTAAATRATLTGLVPGTAYRFRVLARNADGVGPASSLSAATVQPFTSLAAFADRQHRDFVGRAPTSAETASWTTRIGDGSLTPVAAIDGLNQGSYWQRQSPVIRLYRAYYLRLPDTAGLSYWVGQVRAGVSLARISQSFSGTPEFDALYGSLTDRQFVARVYQNVLGRPGSTADLDYWTAEITSGRRSRGAVMLGFSESPEYRAQTQGTVDAVNLFTGLIRRVPTTAENTTWSRRTRAQIIVFLLASSAYAARTKVEAPLVPGPLAGIVQISSSDARTCGVTGSGSLVCWGRMIALSAGSSTIQTWRTARVVLGISGVRSISVGDAHTCAVLTTGRLRCWGLGIITPLGDGTETNVGVPGVDPGLSGVTSVSAGLSHTCAVLGTGRIRCWGSNGRGQLGDGTTTDRLVPTEVSGITTAVGVAVGSQYTCAVLANGQVRCWGLGAVGASTSFGFTTPQTVAGVSGATAVAAGNVTSCAWADGGTLRCWGQNPGAAGGDGVTPVVVGGVPQAVAAETNSPTPQGYHACAASADGSVRCWGYRRRGKLGDGVDALQFVGTPQRVLDLPAARAVTLGGDHSCALTTAAGAVWCWGDNEVGAVGDGTSTSRSRAVQVIAA